MDLKVSLAISITSIAILVASNAYAGPDLPLNQYVSPDDFAPDLTQPPGDYEFRSFAGFTWATHEAETHRAWLGNAFGDRFMSRTLSYCDGSAFGQKFDCFEDKELYLYDRSQLNVQPLYKCFDAVVGDTYISWFEDCDEPGIGGAPTGEGPYPYESGMPDHFLGYTACTAGPFFWITPYDPYDLDEDGVFGDCDDDDDNDGVKDVDDNCALIYNPAQENLDGDVSGDACDTDDDGDGVPDEDDNCPRTPNADQADRNDDGMGDACDDSDGDGVLDIDDNCPVHPNPEQEDFDDNDFGDACENKDDDMFVDALDNCILIPNNDQRDTNTDGFGNLCDPDLNNDCEVNFEDLGDMRTHYFSDFENADLNGDGAVNAIDLGIMKSLFFLPPGPAGSPNNCD